MTVVRLIVKNNALYFPFGGPDFDRAPGAPASPDLPTLLICRYDDGDYDTVPYPFPKRKAAELRKRLARALFDERECNDLFPRDAVIELPDGTPFDAHAVLKHELNEAAEPASDNGAEPEQ
jgi:hypothetical protein